MRKIAVLCLLSLFFAGSLSAQVVSDPDQVRDLSVSLKMSLGAIMGNDMDMPTVVGVGAEAEYFHNRKWLIFASAQNLVSIESIGDDDISLFKNHGYFDLAGGFSLMNFEKSRESQKKVSLKRGSYMVDTLYWVKNDINDITKHNLLLRGGLHVKANSIRNHRYDTLANGRSLYDYGYRRVVNENYRMSSPFLGVEYRFTKGYSYVIRREFHNASSQISIFADVFLTSFLDDNVEVNNANSSGTFFPGIISDEETGDLYLDKFGFRIGVKRLKQNFKSVNYGWRLELVSQPDVREFGDANNMTILMYTILYTL